LSIVKDLLIYDVGLAQTRAVVKNPALPTTTIIVHIVIVVDAARIFASTAPVDLEIV
jgi:hypothetical protein